MSSADQLTKEEEMRAKSRAEWARLLEAGAEWLATDPGRLARARSVGLNRRWPRAHFHPTSELFLQLGGATRFEGPEQRWELPAGNLGLMPRGVPHSETPLDRTTPYEMAVTCHTRTGFILIRAKAQTDANGARRIIPTDVLPVVSERGREAFRYLDEAEQAWAGGDEGRGLATDFTRVFLQVLAAETRRATSRERLYSPLVESARVLVRSHLAETRLSVEWLARAAGCTPDHLTRLFRQELGSTVVAWIAEERVSLAQRLLREGRYQVAEVAWACGFAQPSYFIRVFRAKTGVTPLAWKRAEARRSPDHAAGAVAAD